MRKVAWLAIMVVIAGLVVAPTAAFASRLISTFNAGLSNGPSLVGLAFSSETDTVLVYGEFDDPIHEFTSGGEFVGTIPRPGVVGNDFDMDVVEETFPLGQNPPLPEGSILVINGEQSPADVFGIDRQGGVLAQIQLPGLLVGGSYHNDRDTLFVVDWGADVIRELDPVSGSVFREFPVEPAGSPLYDVFYGDVAVHPTSGNVFVVTDVQSEGRDYVREFTPTGAFVRDYEVTSLGVSQMTGIDFDVLTGEAWISTRTGGVFNVALAPGPNDRVGTGGGGGGGGGGGEEPDCDPSIETCGTSGDDEMQTEDGHIVAGAGNDQVTATITSETTSITVDAGTGDDIIELQVQDPSSNATITLNGQDGSDTFLIPPSPGALEPILNGGEGNDFVRVVQNTSPRLRALARAQDEVGGYNVTTGIGNDSITVGSTPDTVDAGTGRDIVRGAGGADDLLGAGGPDGIDGGTGNDDLLGGSGDDVLHGAGGANRLVGGTGRDTCLSDTRQDRLQGCERVRRNHRRNHSIV